MITDRLPTADDADLHGLVRWDPRLPGMMVRWDTVRLGEAWCHTSSWVSRAPEVISAKELMEGDKDYQGVEPVWADDVVAPKPSVKFERNL